MARPRPTLAQLGLNRLTRWIIGLIALELAVCVVLYPRLGLSFAWRANLTPLPLAVGPFAMWAYYVIEPGPSRRDWLIAQRVLVLGLFLVIFVIEPQAQYVALAFKRPVIDHWLAAGDAAFHVDIVALN